MINNTLTVTNPYEIIDQLNIEVERKNLKIAELEALVKHYEHQLLNAKRHQFGASSQRTEIDSRQLSIFGEATLPEPPPVVEEITYKRKKQKGKREKDLSGLPVVRVDYELPEDERDCPKCGLQMHDVGVNIRREIELIPAKVIVKEHATHSYACHNDECKEPDSAATGVTTFVKAEAPKPLISGSLASASLVAHIAVSKYSTGLPLYRIEKGFQYDGVNISRQTMSNWVITCAELYLMPIYALLTTFLLKTGVLHADETTVQVLHESGRKAQSKSYEWVYRTGCCSKYKIVVYDYKETREQKHPQKFLKDFRGYLHTDGYQAYHNIPGAIVVGCWFHVRQYWEKMYKNLPAESREGSNPECALAYINRLFELDRKFEKLSPEERFKQRLEHSKPVSDNFFTWIESLNPVPKTPLAQAVTYALSQREYLENVFLDGRLELSNNRCERSVKPFVMGRKAWLFSNTPAGAEASSIMYSLIETAKENGLHPYHYIKFLLETLPNTTTSNLETLLPWSEALPDWCRAPMRGGV